MKCLPVLYATYYSILVDAARDNGYALALHGSLIKDMDLIAVAWIENPESHTKLLQAFRDIIGMHNSNGIPYDSMEIKPCNRIAYTIQSGGGGYFDISIVGGNQ